MLVATLLFPVLLLALPLLMDEVERPLRSEALVTELTGALATARPDDLEQMVSEGYGAVVRSYWRRRRLTTLLALRSRG